MDLFSNFLYLVVCKKILRCGPQTFSLPVSLVELASNSLCTRLPNIFLEIWCVLSCNFNSFGNKKRYYKSPWYYLSLTLTESMIWRKNAWENSIKKIVCKLGNMLQICYDYNAIFQVYKKVFFAAIFFLNHWSRECFRKIIPRAFGITISNTSSYSQMSWNCI